MKPEYSWIYEEGGDIIALQKDGNVLAHLFRYSDDKTGDHAWWSAETPDGRPLGIEEYLVDICRRIAAEVGFAVDPPAALLAEEPPRQTDIRADAVTMPESPNLKAKTPVNGLCEECGHVWPVAFAPMPLYRFAAVIKNAHCPRCGAESDNLRIMP